MVGVIMYFGLWTLFGLALLSGHLAHCRKKKNSVEYKYDHKGAVSEVSVEYEKTEGKPVGIVIMPTTEIEDARQRVLDRNKALGVDTKIEELM